MVDNSATMAARTTDGRTRLDHALERARELIVAAGAGSRFLVADTMRQLPTPVFEDRDAA